MTPDTIHQLIKVRAERLPESAAILGPARAPLTYGRLLRQVHDIVSHLNRLGIGRNDRVAIVLPNGPEMAVAFLSIASGATSGELLSFSPDDGLTETFPIADHDRLACQVSLPNTIVVLISPVVGAPVGVHRYLSERQAPKNQSRSRRMGPPSVTEALEPSDTCSSGS